MKGEVMWKRVDGATCKYMVTARWCPKVTVIVTTSELSQFTYPYRVIVQPSSSRVNSVRELYCCWLLSC